MIDELLRAGIVGELAVWTWLALVSAFLFVPPGWALLTLASHLSERPYRGFHWSVKLTSAIGVSLALYPVRMLVARAMGWQAGAAMAWLASVLALIVLAWLYRHRIRGLPAGMLRWRPDACDTVLIVLALVILFARFWVIRPLSVPMWGDGYQHAMITQLMLDNGGLFSSWAPYTPYTSLTIQYGFSALASVLAWMTGLDGTGSTLWMGQIVNALAVLTIYPLAVRIADGNRWAGVGAVLVVGLALSHPAYYVNWGRYAQLSGQAVLPVLIWLTWEAVDPRLGSLRRSWPLPAMAGLVLAGMTLHYYRTPILYAAFVLVLLGFWALPTLRLAWRPWASVLGRLALIGLVSLVLLAPWLMNLMSGQIAYGVEAGVTIGEPREWVLGDFDDLRQIQTYVPLWAMVLVLVAVAWAIAARNAMVIGLLLWFALLLAYRGGALIRLPAANMLRVFAVLIAAYIPVGLAIGWLLGQLVDALQQLTSGGRRSPPAEGKTYAPTPTEPWALDRLPRCDWGEPVARVVALVVLVVGLLFGFKQLSILDRDQFELVTPADVGAMAWTSAHTDPDAVFLVQGFPYSITVAGSDAGWWIPLLARRENTIPPQYAQFNESSDPPDHTRKVLELYEHLDGHALHERSSLDRLCDWGITHVYQGARQGSMGGPPLFTTEDLAADPEAFTQVYADGPVAIYEVAPSVCEGRR